MRMFLLLSAVGLIVALAQPARAEITFRCDAGAGTECAFSAVHADGQGMTNFVLGPKQTHGLNDNFAGGHYCVVVSKPRAQIRDWPPTCRSAVDNTIGKAPREPLKAGQTYN
jgi:hypothetical protein